MPSLNSGRFSRLLSCLATSQLTGLVLFIHEVLEQSKRGPARHALVLEQAASPACCFKWGCPYTRLSVCSGSCQQELCVPLLVLGARASCWAVHPKNQWLRCCLFCACCGLSGSLCCSNSPCVAATCAGVQQLWGTGDGVRQASRLREQGAHFQVLGHRSAGTEAGLQPQ